MSEQGTLTSLVTVHCFLHPRCHHIEVACDPVSAHDRMEAHYSAKHTLVISAITGGGSR